MDDNSRDRLTLARCFLEPSDSTHRQYEALRAFFVDGVPSAEAAARFGYTPASFRVLVHQFRNHPGRDFFLPTAREGRPPGKQKRLRERVVALRKQNLSVHDISHSLSRDGEPLSPAAVAAILNTALSHKSWPELSDEFLGRQLTYRLTPQPVDHLAVHLRQRHTAAVRPRGKKPGVVDHAGAAPAADATPARPGSCRPASH